MVIHGYRWLLVVIHGYSWLYIQPFFAFTSAIMYLLPTFTIIIAHAFNGHFNIQLQQCTRNQAFLRYSVGDTVLGGVYSTRDHVKNGKSTDAHIS